MTMKDSIVASFGRERRPSRVTNVQDLINTLSLWNLMKRPAFVHRSGLYAF
jgi:hypothetical protein